MVTRARRQGEARASGDPAAPKTRRQAGADGLAVSAPGFVGRGRELAVLTKALADPPAVVLVEGEAGVGKTRLVQEFVASRQAGASQVLLAVCPPYRELLTLGPVVDAVRQTRPSVAGVELSALAGALRPVFPEWAAGLPPAPEPLDDAKLSRHRLFRALAEFLDRLGVTLLVVEDAHWADEATLEFLLLLTSRHHETGPSLVVTYRPEDVAEDSLLLRLSSRLPAGSTQLRIALAPLDVSDTAAMASSMLGGQRLSESFAAFLHDRADGLPLAVEESIRLLADRADLVRRDGEWVRLSLSELQVPPTIRDSTLERFYRLRPAARRVLRAAAVLSDPVDEATLTRVAGVPASAGRSGVAEALTCGLLHEDARGRLGFRHVLAAAAVYEAMPAPERRRLHGRAGDALEAVEPPPTRQLARHFREAGQATKWSRYAVQAADLAMVAGDHTTATILLLGPLTTGTQPPRVRAQLARKLATAALSRRETVDGLHDQVVDALRRVLDAGGLRAAEQAEIRNPLGRLLLWSGDFDAAHAELEQAVSDLQGNPVEAARVMVYLGLPFMSPWPASVHLRWLRRAAEVDLSLLSPVDRLAITADRAVALLFLGEEEGWAVAAALPGEVSSVEERRHLARAYLNLGSVAVRWGRYAEARRRLGLAFAIADSDGLARLRWQILGNQARLDWYTGAWEGLDEPVASLLAAEDITADAHLEMTCLAGWLHAARGSRRAAEERFSAALEQNRQRGAVEAVLEPAAALGRLRLLEDDVDGAVRVTAEPMRTLMTKDVWVWAADLAPVRVEALVAGGARDEAEQVVERFGHGLRRRQAPAAAAALAVCRAVVMDGRGDPARAAAAFEQAAGAWDELPRPYDALLTRERRARCLIAANDVEEGLGLLAKVYEGLYDLGARGDADRVAQRLREHGGQVPRLWRGGRKGYGDQLSPRELEVVRLVIAGRTNREIARALSKSRATVGRQLQSAMRKLGVSSRTALAVAAVEAGVFAEEREPD